MYGFLRTVCGVVKQEFGGGFIQCNAVFIPTCYINAVQDDISSKTVPI